jgi:hypothetical protein
VMPPILRNVSAISWCDIWSSLAVESSKYGVHLTSASVRVSNCPTKSLYTLFVWSWAYEVCIQTKCEP